VDKGATKAGHGVTQVRVWDGRGDALGESRLTTAAGRMADDLRLKLPHFRIMAHVGRQNAQRGWLRVSQSELAERWACHRNTLNRAFLDLVEWRYLLQRTQEEAGESFCLYKVSLDGDEPSDGIGNGPSEPREKRIASDVEGGECTVECAPHSPELYRGSAQSDVHMCTVESAPVHSGGVHPPRCRIENARTDYRRISPIETPPLPPQPTHAPAQRRQGAGGLESHGWAKGWDAAARNALFDLTGTSAAAVAVHLLLPLVGTLNPPAGVHGASYVRDVAEQLGHWPEPVLAALAGVVRIERVRDLPAAGKLRQMARAVAAHVSAGRAAPAGAPQGDLHAQIEAWQADLARADLARADLAPGGPGDRLLLLRALALRLGPAVAWTWFRDAETRRTPDALELTLPGGFQARYAGQRFTADLLLAVQALWPGITDVVILPRSNQETAAA
jgi:hypothetical protein